MKISFETEVSWGDIREWHPAPNLSFEIEDGRSSQISQISWRCQDGASASISLQKDLSTFFGFYQKPGEGPIAYRGTRI